jgi:hypothetical protein
VLRQAQHEDTFFVASPNKLNLILSLSKDEAAAPVPGNFGPNSPRHLRYLISLQTPSPGRRVGERPPATGAARDDHQQKAKRRLIPFVCPFGFMTMVAAAIRA